MEYDDEYDEDDEYDGEEEEDENEEVEARPRRRKASGLVKSLSGGTLVTTEIVSAMLHGGVLGIGAGLLASAFVYLKGDEALDAARDLVDLQNLAEMLPLPDALRRRLESRQGNDLKDNEDEWSGDYSEEEVTAFLADWQAAKAKAAKAEKDVVLHLSPSWTPTANSFLSQRTAIIGQPGFGKSNSVADVVEEIGPLGVPLLLLDTEDEHDGLCRPRYLPNARALGAEQVTVQNARAFGESIPAEKLQVVLNLQSYESEDEAALVMCELIAGINEWEEAHQVGERVSCMVILDEAAVWLPQATSESILAKPVLVQLQQTFFRTVVRRGRKRDIGFILATQRIAEIDKRALNATWVILHRQTLPNDLKVYKEYGIEPEATRALQPGQAYVLGPNDFREIVQFRRRRSQDKAFTPGLASVRGHTPQRTEASARSVYHEQQMARTRAREQRLRGIAPQKPAPTSQVASQTNEVAQPKEIARGDLAKAYALWQAGAASVRKLYDASQEKGYGWSNGYCRDLIAAMRELDLIPKLVQSV